MATFLAFASYMFYPRGGAADCIGQFDDLSSAKRAVNNLFSEYRHKGHGFMGSVAEITPEGVIMREDMQLYPSGRSKAWGAPVASGDWDYWTGATDSPAG